MSVCNVYSIQIVTGSCVYDAEAVFSIISAGFTIDPVSNHIEFGVFTRYRIRVIP